MTRGRLSLRYALPLLLWGLVIALFSMGLFRGGLTERMLAAVAQVFQADISPATLAAVHAVLRKSAHVFEYMIFALLVWRLLQREATERWRTSWAVATAALGLLLAGADELHQFYTRSRAGSIVDVGWDALGVALALGWLYWRARRRENTGKAQGLALPEPH